MRVNRMVVESDPTQRLERQCICSVPNQDFTCSLLGELEISDGDFANALGWHPKAQVTKS